MPCPRSATSSDSRSSGGRRTPCACSTCTPALNVSTDGCSFSRPASLATITPAAATAANATARPCIEPEMSTTRHTARRCAVQVRVTMSSAPGRRDVLGVHASSVRSRSRSPSSPRDAPSRRVPRAFAGPTRPSCRNTRPASRRAAARSATSVATAMSASIAAAASGVLGDGRVERLRVQLADLGRDLVERRVLLAELLAAVGARRPLATRSRAGLEARRGATRRALGFSLGVRGLRRVGVGGPQPVQQLVDHRLGRAFHTVGHADAAGERGVGGVPRGVAAGVRLAAQLGQAGQHQREVDRPAHRRAHAHVAVLARGPGQPDREVDPAPGQPADRRRDRPLTRVVLVAEHDPAHPVGDGLARPARCPRRRTGSSRRSAGSPCPRSPCPAAGRRSRPR